MTLSLYDATVPSYLQVLTAVSGVLDKLEAHCVEAALPETELLEARLAPDMWDMACQIRAVVIFSSLAVAGTLVGEAVPDFSPPPYDVALLKARIEAAIGTLKGVGSRRSGCAAG